MFSWRGWEREGKKWSRGGKSYRVIKERRGIKEGSASKVEGVHVWASVQREATTRCTGVNRPPANLHTPKPTRSLLDDLEFPATKLLRFIRRVYLASVEKRKKKKKKKGIHYLLASMREQGGRRQQVPLYSLSLSLFFSLFLVSNSYLYTIIFRSKVRSWFIKPFSK